MGGRRPLGRCSHFRCLHFSVVSWPDHQVPRGGAAGSTRCVHAEALLQCREYSLRGDTPQKRRTRDRALSQRALLEILTQGGKRFVSFLFTSSRSSLLSAKRVGGSWNDLTSAPRCRGISSQLGWCSNFCRLRLGRLVASEASREGGGRLCPRGCPSPASHLISQAPRTTEAENARRRTFDLAAPQPKGSPSAGNPQEPGCDTQRRPRALKK